MKSRAKKRVVGQTKRRADPFRVEMADGTAFTFKDPATIKRTGALDPAKPEQFFSLILGDDDRAAFFKHPEIDGYFVDAILEKYLEHYGLK